MGLIKGFNLGTWLGHAAQSAGKAVGSGVGAVGKGIDKIPVIGKPLNSALDIGIEPLKIGANIAKGKNVGQAAMAGLKSTVNDTKNVATIAPAVISFVPGVGTVASSAIAAGAAIAEGKRIDQIGEAAALAAIPGGTLAAAAAKMGKDVLSGKIKDIGQAASDVVSVASNAAGVQLPQGATNVLAAGIDTTKALANGQKPNPMLIASALPALGPVVGPQVQTLVNQDHLEDAANTIMASVPKQLANLPPKTAQNVVDAVKVGAAIGHAKQLQSLQKTAIVDNIARFEVPEAVSKMTVPERALRSKLPVDETRGYDIGINVKNCKCTQFQIQAVRESLKNSREQDGFDSAISMHIGQVFSAVPRGTPEFQAGYLLHQGIRHSEPQHVQNVLQPLPPKVQVGALASARETDSASGLIGALKTTGGTIGGALLGLRVFGPVGAIVGGALGRLLTKEFL